jgi:hypothetical protein
MNVVGVWLSTWDLLFRFPSSSQATSDWQSFLARITKGKMHSVTVYALGVAVLGFVVYALLDAASKYNSKHNPQGLPGPFVLPWIGRIHDLPIEFMWLKFKEWADIYGPIYRTKMLGDNFIIITDEKIAEDILIKRAKVYSDRPEIKSLFDAKSTHGSMEYLPLMGKNRKTKCHALYDIC